MTRSSLGLLAIGQLQATIQCLACGPSYPLRADSRQELSPVSNRTECKGYRFHMRAMPQLTEVGNGSNARYNGPHARFPLAEPFALFKQGKKGLADLGFTRLSYPKTCRAAGWGRQTRRGRQAARKIELSYVTFLNNMIRQRAGMSRWRHVATNSMKHC